jgi:ATP-dependent helicase/nuclease subunit A
MSPLTAAQLAIVDDTGANRCVTSGAGCGKTSVLVERYIRFLEEDLGLGLARLAAITFTDAAAAQMRDRIRKACRRHIEEARKAGDTRAVQTWLERYWDADVAPIDTIHAFCGSLLRRYAIEAGVDPNFALLDEAEATFLVEEIVRRTIEKTLAQADAAGLAGTGGMPTLPLRGHVSGEGENMPSERRAGHATLGNSASPESLAANDLLAVLEHFTLDQAREVLAVILREDREALQRVAGPAMARSDEEILRDLKKAVDEMALALLRGAVETPAAKDALATAARHSGAPGDTLEDMRRAALDEVGRLATARGADHARAAAQRLADLINARPRSAKQWPSQDDFDAVKAALVAIKKAVKDAADAVPEFDPAAEAQHLAAARALFRTAARAIEAYQAAKQARSALDFEDLQIRARDLLRESERVRQECRKRFRAILVDELQDTNSLQFEIVDLLAGDEGGRRGTPLRPGALFGVGDPKQSIYRFRGAEFEVFQRARNRVEPAGRKGLSESFRLNPGTAALVNQLFPPLMGDLYEPILGMREQRNAAVGEVLYVADPAGGGFASEAGIAAEAAHLAARLKELIEKQALSVEEDGKWRPAGYGDVAVLMRRMSYLHLYERALENARVPYYVVAGRGFFKQQEVLDVLHLLRVLDDPSDDLHLAGVLRSPFFAVSDEGLYHLHSAGRSLYDALVKCHRIIAHSGTGCHGCAVQQPCRDSTQSTAANSAAVAPSVLNNAQSDCDATRSPSAGADHLATEDRRGLRRAAELLPAWAAAKDRVGLAALVEETVFASGYAASAVGRFGGERAYANLRQMVELARRFEQKELYSLGDYIDYVTDFMSSEMRAEQAPVEAPGAQAVRLMTIHKAKGLEFPIVVLPDLAHALQAPRNLFFIHPVAGMAVYMRDEDGASRTSAAMALARGDAVRADQAEAHRLLYVAVTRAKDYLIFASHQVGMYTERGQKTWFDVLVGGLDISLKPGAPAAQLPAGHKLLVSVQPPTQEDVRHGDRRVGPRDLLVDGRVAWARLQERGQRAAGRIVQEAVEHVGPLSITGQPPTRITATALATYRRCPAAYWWSEVLGVDEPQPSPAAGPGPVDKGRPAAARARRKAAAAGASDRIAPRDWGRLSHRAMELAVAPDAASLAAAVNGAIREIAPGPASTQDELRVRLTAVVQQFWAGDIGRRVAAARQTHRELPFVLAMDDSEIRGVMDLVFQNADGQWEVLDYKAAAPAPQRAEQAAEEYGLQLGLYALAAGKWLRRPVRRWTVCFLDAARPLERELTSADLKAVEAAAGEALAAIASGRFAAERQTEACERCRFQSLCG